MKKRLVSLLLAIVLMVGIFPASALAANDNEDYIYLEANQNTTIRKEPYADSAILKDDVGEGDLLLCVDSVVNKYDNLWYQVVCGNSYGYIFSEKTTPHEHELTKLKDDTIELRYCRCGYAEVSQYGVVMQGDTLALPGGGLLTPEEIQALRGLANAAKTLAGTMGALGGTVAAGLKSVLLNPYVILPVTACGIAYWAYVRADGTSAELVDVKKAKSYAPEELEDGKYYYTGLLNGSVVFFDYEGVDMEDAEKYILAVAAIRGVSIPIGKKTVKLGSVYTKQPGDALKLGKSIEKTGCFFYGGDAPERKDPAMDKYFEAGKLYFEHYHIYRGNAAMSRIGQPKVDGVHIWFGIPYIGFDKRV